MGHGWQDSGGGPLRDDLDSDAPGRKGGPDAKRNHHDTGGQSARIRTPIPITGALGIPWHCRPPTNVMSFYPKAWATRRRRSKLGSPPPRILALYLSQSCWDAL